MSPLGETDVTDSFGRAIKIWDYHAKSCVQTLEGHTANVSFAIFHPSLPLIISGSEDGTIKLWHSSTYRLENTLSYGLERAWCVAYRKAGNEVAVGYDEGAVVVKVCSQSEQGPELMRTAWTRRAVCLDGRWR